MSDRRLPQTSTVWAVVNTHPSREGLALQHLGRQDFEAYCPMIAKRLKQANRYIDVARPLFPGYLFVRVTPQRDQWRPMLSTIGVRTVIRFGEQLGCVDSEFIDSLRQREQDGLISRPMHPFEVGQQVRVTSGPFDGVIATIVSMTEKDRLVVLMDLLSRKVQVHMTSDQLGTL
jgi:transcriptional antiterminator RfaH